MTNSLKLFGRKAILSNFLIRESTAYSSSIPTSSTLIPTIIPSQFHLDSAISSNPFAPTKTFGSNSWRKPKYSVRRQKVLRKRVEELGWPTNVLPPTHLNHFETIAAAAPPRPARLYNASANIPVTSVLTALKLERKGPYTGRKGAAFKGKIWERKMGARVEELRVALEATGLKEATWRKVCRRINIRLSLECSRLILHFS